VGLLSSCLFGRGELTPFPLRGLLLTLAQHRGEKAPSFDQLGTQAERVRPPGAVIYSYPRLVHPPGRTDYRLEMTQFVGIADRADRLDEPIGDVERYDDDGTPGVVA
jgi:hypothetical protein